jgi:hemolysin activation/secretion protein
MDGGQTWYSDKGIGEYNEDLFGVGVGAELQFMRYLRAGVDLGFPRSKLSNGDRGGNSPEVHALVTLMF